MEHADDTVVHFGNKEMLIVPSYTAMILLMALALARTCCASLHNFVQLEFRGHLKRIKYKRNYKNDFSK